MELLFVMIIGLLSGAVLRYASASGRDTYGYLLVPGIVAVVDAIVWEALTWAGWAYDGGWIWVASLLAGPIVGLIVALTLPRGRRTADRALMTRLSGGRA